MEDTTPPWPLVFKLSQNPSWSIKEQATVEFVELSRGVVFGFVAHVNPVDHKLLDLAARKVAISFLDALNRLFDIEPFCVGPNHFAFPGVEMHVLQQFREGIVYFPVFLTFRRVHPLEESFDEGVVREDAFLFWMFLAWLAHAVLDRVRANETRFVLTRSRML